MIEIMIIETAETGPTGVIEMIGEIVALTVEKERSTSGKKSAGFVPKT
jgi:hypothetical protein